MECVKELLVPKRFNPKSFFVVIGSLVMGSILLGVVAIIETGEQGHFKCRIKGEDNQFLERNCFADYQGETTRGFPLYAFVLLYFLLVTAVCVSYSLSVQSRIEDLKSQLDPERVQPNPPACLYRRYCIQLAVRCGLGITFLVLQWGVFYPLKFPYDYACDLSHIHHDQAKPVYTTSGAGNATGFLYDCYNSQAGKKTFWTIVIFTVLALFTVFILVELIYVMRKAKAIDDFKKDLEFYKIHLQRSSVVENGRESVAGSFSTIIDEQETSKIRYTRDFSNRDDNSASERVIVNWCESVADSSPTVVEEETSNRLRDISNIVENYASKVKENIMKDTVFYESLLPNKPGEERKLQELDKIYTNMIMYPGRAQYDFEGGRQKINKGYLKSQERHEAINNLKDIFLSGSKPGNPREVPRSIMIIGRPGIGKSLFSLKILRDWACDKLFKEEAETGKCFKFVFLIKFRHFDDTKTINLKQLLERALGQFSVDPLPDEVYKWILKHPEKVLLLFDGLDEFGNKENIAREQEFENSPEEQIPFSAIYAKLTLGKLLKGATVVTTSRPTALSNVTFPHKSFDRTLEALGFSTEQIEIYVKKFCQDSNGYGEQIWNHISSNGNLLSLCYIPVTCHILCFSFQERLKRNKGKHKNNDLPTTLTEIYEDALMVIVCNHNPEYRSNVQQQEKLLSSPAFPPGIEKSLESLGKIAYQGIEQDRLIFESEEVKGHEESGLLHRLPDEKAGPFRHKEQHCFLHLTIQEFLAAKYIVAHLKGNEFKDLQSWISCHLRQGKWEVVMQFVAGLLYDQGDVTQNVIKIFIESLPGQTSGQTKWPISKKEKILALQLFKYIYEISRNSTNKTLWQTELLKEKWSGVVDLNLSSASLTDADLTSVAFVLQEAESIKSLDISSNHITSVGCLEIVLKLVTMLGQLIKLNISCNRIGDDGVKYLSEALSSSKWKITTLYISDNKIDDNGVKHLFKALSSSKCKLTTLDISRNKISDDGAKHLCDALSSNKCLLTTLNISSNQISDVGVKPLSKALSSNKRQLVMLDFRNNGISDTGKKHLSDALFSSNCDLYL